VLVPYRPDGGFRDRAWAYVRRRWETLGVELVVESPGPGAHPGEFNHPAAINRAAARARGDVFVVADADTAFEFWWPHAALAAIEDGASWVMPRLYHKLTGTSTERVLEGLALSRAEREWTGDSICWSGLVVVPRDAFERVGGYDERFAFWGADDVCFGLTMDALVGRHERLEGAAYHLWHPAPHQETYGHRRHAGQDALMRRYTAAAEDAEALREVRFG
jgi:hypothetical protein